MNKDYMIKATAGNGRIRAYIAQTTNIVQEASDIHHTSLAATAALGRLLTGASLMGAMLKNEEELITLTIQGDGPLQGIVATSDMTANVKGYVFHPEADAPLRADGKIDVAAVVGKGTLNVIKDLGMGEPVVGQVKLVSGEIGEDLTYYYAQSEQTPSAVALGVLVDVDYRIKSAGGFILQLMPDVEEETVQVLEQNIQQLPPLTTLLEQGNSLEDILERVVGVFGLNVIEKIEIQYSCNCSKRRVEKALISIGSKEIEQIIQEDGEATLHCHFCGKDYYFSKEDLETIAESIK